MDYWFILHLNGIYKQQLSSKIHQKPIYEYNRSIFFDINVIWCCLIYFTISQASLASWSIKLSSYRKTNQTSDCGVKRKMMAP